MWGGTGDDTTNRSLSEGEHIIYEQVPKNSHKSVNNIVVED